MYVQTIIPQVTYMCKGNSSSWSARKRFTIKEYKVGLNKLGGQVERHFSVLICSLIAFYSMLHYLYHRLRI